MKTRKLIALAAAIVLFGACIPSVNPFYIDKDVVFDGGDKVCKLTVTGTKNKHGGFEARQINVAVALRSCD